jgi:hypothetical protein
MVRNFHVHKTTVVRLFEFPAYSVAVGHIRFIYNNESISSMISKIILPVYVCYNQKLCGSYLSPTTYLRIDNSSLACRLFEQITMPKSNEYKNTWILLQETIEEIFTYCLSSNQLSYNLTDGQQFSTLY